METPSLLRIIIWPKTAKCTHTKLDIWERFKERDPNLLVSYYSLYFIKFDGLDGIFTAMVDFGATNSFVHSEVIQ